MALLTLGGILGRTIDNQGFGLLIAGTAVITICLTYFGWLWTVATFVYSENKTATAISLRLFKSLFLSAIAFSFFINPILKSWNIPELVNILRILGLLSTLCFLFCIYLIASILGKLQKDKLNEDSNIVLDFFLIWLLPIGIWFIQPRLKTLLSLTETIDKKPSC
jgi:hypothetical protein